MRRPGLAAVGGLLLCARLLMAQSVLVLYDGEREKSDAFLSARYTQGLLGHFDLDEVRLQTVGECPPRAAAAADFLFVFCEEGRTPLPNELLEALVARRAPIVWVNLQLDELLDQVPGRFPLRAGPEVTGVDWRISYGGRIFSKHDREMQFLRPGKGGCRVVAWAEDSEGRRLPYVVHGSNLWAFADSPFSYAREGGRWLIFCELLHEILGKEHEPLRRVLLRIEDVHPQSDPAALRRIADYLAGEGIPFQVSLVPVYRDPAAQEEEFLSEKTELVAALRTAVEQGAAMVMHGVSHQYRGATTDDYEFWDVIAGGRIPHATPDWLQRRIKLGLAECRRSGLYPIAWETPHYAAGQQDYRVIGGFFDTFFDRPMMADIPDSQILAPFPFHLPELGVQVVPENLGYISFNNRERDLAAMLDNLDNMGIVRDGLAAFFFHPFLPLEDLQHLVREIRSRG
ncbi:MAG: polysaccharide deacetylase family protein, partial [Candidatus Aminicenantes bacterium]|nr:polysaccharide deacetylase family protein [Candidatus Aminicenantes bacterium]